MSKAIPEWTIRLPEAVEKSRCYSDVLRYLEMPMKGNGNRITLKKWIAKLNLDISHFDYLKVVAEKIGTSLVKADAGDPNDEGGGMTTPSGCGNSGAPSTTASS